MDERAYRYWAFISYSHRDTRVAVALQRFLERYRLPRRLVGRASPVGALPRRLFPIFRDRDELPSSPELGTSLQAALAASRYLIVVCSPAAAGSRWVNEEIRQFRELDRGGRILALIVDGEPNSAEPARECFPPLLRASAGYEPIAADLRKAADGPRLARVKLLAGVLAVGLDELLLRERRRTIQRRLGWIAVAAALLLGIGGMLRLQQTSFHAQKRAAYLADLVETGRKLLLEGAPMRAAAYLSRAYSEGVDTPALRFMLHQAMQPFDALERVVDTGGEIRSMTLSRDKSTLITFTRQGELQVWALPGMTMKTSIKVSGYEPTGSSCSPEISPDGLFVSFMWTPRSLNSALMKLWSLQTGDALVEAKVSASTCSPTFSSDGSVLAAITPEGRVMQWRLDGGESATLAAPPLGRVTAVTFSPTGLNLAVGYESGAILCRVGKSLAFVRLGELMAPVQLLEFSEDGARVAATNARGVARLWDTESGRLLFSAGHNQKVDLMATSRNADRLLTAATEGLRLWRTADAAVVYAEAANNGMRSRTIALNEEGSAIAESGPAGAAVVDTESSNRSFEIDHATADIAFYGNGLLIADTAGHLLKWRVGFSPKAMQKHGESIGRGLNWRPVSTVFSLLGSHEVVSAGQDGKVTIWDDEALRPVVDPLFDLDAEAMAIAVSDQSGRIAVGDASGTVTIGTRSGFVNSLQIAAYISSMKMSADGGHAMAVDQESNGYLIDMNKEIITKIFKLDSRFSYAFSGDSRYLAIASERKGQLIELPGLRVARDFVLSDGSPIGCFAFSRDSAVLMAISRKGSRGKVIDGSDVRDIEMPTAGCFEAKYDAAGRRVLILSGGSMAHIWDAVSGREVSIGRHEGIIYSAGWSADGQFVVTAGTDGAVHVSDANTGLVLRRLNGHGATVFNAGFSTDGSNVYSAGADGRLLAFDVVTEKRSAAAVAERLECISPWRLVSAQLERTQPKFDCIN